MFKISNLKTTFLAFLTLLILNANSQGGMWTWVKGSNTANSLGVYGTKGVEAASNNPPARRSSVGWTDCEGNFWLFGGVVPQGVTSSVFCDLWKYNPITNNWTWVNGSNALNDTGVYGTQGVASPNNYPPARLEGLTWVDEIGDLWLYGGYEAQNISGAKNDLWKYNIASNMWTWVQGSSGRGVHVVRGTFGVASPNNTPGELNHTSASWAGDNNTLWFFGGDDAGIDQNSNVWKYDIATNMWTCMKGFNGFNGAGVYGTKGVPDPANTPHARSVYSSWKDGNGNFWLFGGEDNVFRYNDMWRYEPVTNNWTWMSGTNLQNDNGNYGSYCTPSANYCPSGHSKNTTHWVDACGNFWMYGGINGDDLWCFNPTNLNWRLVKGSNNYTGQMYGTPGVPASSNTPGTRIGVSSWRNGKGEFFVFGGAASSGIYSDLWKFTPDSTCVASNCNTCQTSAPSVSAEKTVFCPGDSTTICVSEGCFSYKWNNNETSQCIKTNLAGNYYVTITDNNGCTAQSNHLAISVFPIQQIAITVNGDTLSVQNAINRQWYLNGYPIEGEQGLAAIYISTQGGSYTVAITDSNGCIVVSNPIVISGIQSAIQKAQSRISLHPQPATNQLNIIIDEELIGVLLNIYNTTGELMQTTQLQTVNSTLDIQHLSAGVYIAEVKQRDSMQRLRWVKM